MKWMLILYALVAIVIQVIVGEYTGKGQGSLSLLVFLFLVQADPRLKFSYILPNIRDKQNDMQESGESEWKN